MEKPEVLPRITRNAKWFESLRAVHQRRLESRVRNAIETSVELLSGKLALPNKIFYGFHGGEEVANASYRTICVGKSAHEYLRWPRVDGVLLGIMAHEISHISDSEANNCSNKPVRFIESVIEEGKADAVGAYVGGEQYMSEYCGEIKDDFKAHAYRALAAQKPRLHSTGQHLNSIADDYTIGFSLVRDIIALERVSEVFEIHRKPFSFYFEKAAELAYVYEAATR